MINYVQQLHHGQATISQLEAQAAGTQVNTAAGTQELVAVLYACMLIRSRQVASSTTITSATAIELVSLLSNNSICHRTVSIRSQCCRQ